MKRRTTDSVHYNSVHCYSPARIRVPDRGRPMPYSGSACLNHPHLMRQVGWLPAEDSRLWNTWRRRSIESTAAPTGACGGSGPLPEWGAGSGPPGWLEGSSLLEVRLPHVGVQDQPEGVRDLSAGVRTRGSRP